MISKFYLIFLVKLIAIYGQDEIMQCRYYNSSGVIYSCDLTIYNPNGLNNFTAINGIHLSGKTDALVKWIFRDQIFVTPNVPSIICKQFKNLVNIDFRSTRIEILDKNSFVECKAVTFIYIFNSQINRIGENTFLNCQNLMYLYLDNNRISQLDEKSFNGASKVQYLYLYNNPIQNFPKNIFKPLTNLSRLEASSTNISVIHSDSFGVHLQLKFLYLQNNQINAFDERIIDKTTVSFIDMWNNLCANQSINDTTVYREPMRLALKTCFLNYENLNVDTTTTISTTASTTTSYFEQTTTTALTLPPGCISGNLDKRMCSIEDEFQDFHGNVTATLQELKDQIKDLNNRPCACQ